MNNEVQDCMVLKASNSALRKSRSRPRLEEVTGTRTDGGSGQRLGKNGRINVNRLAS
jgi:hypothetical protein